MNKRPLEHARDEDLRASAAALERAAKRARELARQTGTDLIVSEGGEVRRIRPDDAGSPPKRGSGRP